MRDNHEGMPELLRAYERGGHYFGVVKVLICGEPIAYEFGVDLSAFKALTDALSTRPFETIDSGPYRYFFSGSWSAKHFSVRIEQGHEGRNFRIAAPALLGSTLAWFLQLRDPADAVHLRQVDVVPEA